MNKVILAGVIALAMSSNVLARSPDPGPAIQNNVNAAAASAAASSHAAAIAAQQQSQKQYNSQRQYNRQTQKTTQANSQVYNDNQQRPSGIAPSVGLGGFASGPCVGTTTQGGFGVGLPGGASFGGSAGRSEMDDECTIRETARIWHAMGNHEMANRVMMLSSVSRRVMTETVSVVPTPAPAVASARHPGCGGFLVDKRGEWYKANCM